MPESCFIDLGLSGQSPNAIGIPTRLLVYARTDGSCDTVRLTVRQAAGSLILFTGVATPDSNGTASIAFYITPPVFPCGMQMWVEAECIGNEQCAIAESVSIACKTATDDAGWPWRLPPTLFCPLIGRSFTVSILAGFALLIMGVGTGVTASIAGGFAVIAGALAIYQIWRIWCNPNNCHAWGAFVWALKRAFIGGIIMNALLLSVEGILISFLFGVLSGVVTGKLRHAGCPIPSATTAVNQLPLW